MKRKLSVFMLGVLGHLLMVASSAFAQGTAFTYQGQLMDQGTPANGVYDFRFKVFDAVSAGTQVGLVMTSDDVPVHNGLFTVTLDPGTSVFTGAPRWLEIGVRPGSSSGLYVSVLPRHSIAAAPYAIAAGTVTGPINGSAILNGTITGSQLAPGTVTSALAASGQAGVASGGMVLSLSGDNSALVNAGYVKLGNLQASDGWQQHEKGGSPGARKSHTALWTGGEMLIWGGSSDGIYFNDGGRYNPATDFWSPMSTTGAPAKRHLHTVVWTGKEMIVWGGTGTNFLGDGGRYNPVINSWSNLTTNGAPEARAGHTAVWTGSEMIIWGGSDGGLFNSGGHYNPQTDAWARPALQGAPTVRTLHTAVWTGSRMLIWGGLGALGAENSGGLYDPGANTWAGIPVESAPNARYNHTAVWTGDLMVVWGGRNDRGLFADGGRYDLRANRWSALSAAGEFSARESHTAIWTGTEMLIWGGSGAGSYFGDGARYDPGKDVWTLTSAAGAPSGRAAHSAVWTGTHLLVWGGANSASLRDGRRYSASDDSWTPMTAGSPSPRSEAAAIWTGSEMIIWSGRLTSETGTIYFTDLNRYNPALNIWTAGNSAGAPAGRIRCAAHWTGTAMLVWGGLHDGILFNDGGLYNPGSDSWTLITTNGAPVERESFTSVWTGTEMIVWGGAMGAGSAATVFGDGARFNPALGTWTALPTNGAPAARYSHTAVWSGSEMIVWGGESLNSPLKNGAAYNPSSNTWSNLPPTTLSSRYNHCAAWSGSEMIIWGGTGPNGVGVPAGPQITGARYSPTTHAWSDMATVNAPDGGDRSSVWAGNQLIIWGDGLASSARYDPAANTWSAMNAGTAPSNRYYHSVVWTGTEMIIFGGQNQPVVAPSTVQYGDLWGYVPGKNMYLYQKP
jgi:N-acetylneuraminic acid mutarotase